MDPSKNITSTPNNSPPVSPPPLPSEHDNTPTETNPIPDAEGSSENVIMKTAEEVWAELTAGDDEIYGNEGGDGGNEDGRAQDGGAARPMVIVLTADGGNVPVKGSGDVGGSVKGSKKRKSNQVKDPPQGIPTCPECKRQFATWKATFEHMRKHPERLHRGFFPPPTFRTTTEPRVPAAKGDGGNQVDEGVQHILRGLVVDLNHSIGPEEGSSVGGSAGKKINQRAPFVLPPGSVAAHGTPQGFPAPLPPLHRRNEPAPHAADDEKNEEGGNKGFNLNRLPSSDDGKTREN